MDIVIVDAHSAGQYLSGVADVHYGAYSRDHFTSCFSKTLLEEYYKYLICNSNLSLVAIENGKVVGFVVGGYSVGRGVSQFISDRRSDLLKVFVKNPKFIFEKLWSAVSSRLRRRVPVITVSEYRLMSIAVKPSIQSRGVGATLLKFFEKNLLDNNISEYGLSVRKKNERAVEFYIKNGFKPQKETRDSLYFYKELNND